MLAYKQQLWQNTRVTHSTGVIPVKRKKKKEKVTKRKWTGNVDCCSFEPTSNRKHVLSYLKKYSFFRKLLRCFQDPSSKTRSIHHLLTLHPLLIVPICRRWMTAGCISQSHWEFWHIRRKGVEQTQWTTALENHQHLPKRQNSRPTIHKLKATPT